MADNLPTPESREETFLAKAAGENVELPTPESRKELFLNAIAQGGGGGGGGSVQPSDYMYDLGKFYKKWQESPTPEDPYSITTEEYEEVYNAILNKKILLMTMDDLENSGTIGVFVPSNYDFVDSSGTHVMVEVYFTAGGGLELRWEDGNPTATFYM